jgi:tetratricopeptide (TPR) repeat protein
MLCASLCLAWSIPASASPWTIRTSSGPAETGDARAEAEREWKAGSNDYALGNYEQAVAHFERSYELSGEAAILDNLGQSYRRWYDISQNPEHLRKAAKLWENFLLYLESSADLPAEELEAGMAETRERIDEAHATLEEHEREQDEKAGGAGANGGGTDTGDGKKDDRPVYKKGWFWGVIVGSLAVVAGVTTAVVLTTRNRDDDFDPELGTIGGRAPLGPALIRF